MGLLALPPRLRCWALLAALCASEAPQQQGPPPGPPPALRGHPGHEVMQVGPLQIEFEEVGGPPGGMPPELMEMIAKDVVPQMLHMGPPPGVHMGPPPGVHMMRGLPPGFHMGPPPGFHMGPPPGVHMGPPPGLQMMMGPPPGAQKSGIEVDGFHDLFPGPLMFVEEPGGPGGPMGLPGIPDGPFGAPDPLVMDMLQHLTGSFQDGMLPLIHKGAHSAKRAPASCHADLVKHCSSARSQVHCLGEHREDVSQACQQDVGKSVPFVCSMEISKFCSVLQQGILPCLSGHMNDVSGVCRDAVAATQEVITKANTLQSSVVDVKTGAKGVHTPSLAPPAAAPAALAAAPDASAPPPRPVQVQPALALAQAPHHPGGLPTVPGALRAAGVVCALLVFLCGVYFTDGLSRFTRSWKPYLGTGGVCKPLTGGIKPLRPPMSI